MRLLQDARTYYLRLLRFARDQRGAFRIIDPTLPLRADRGSLRGKALPFGRADIGSLCILQKTHSLGKVPGSFGCAGELLIELHLVRRVEVQAVGSHDRSETQLRMSLVAILFLHVAFPHRRDRAIAR